MEKEKKYPENNKNTTAEIKQLQERLCKEDFIKILEAGEEQSAKFEQATINDRKVSEKIRKKPFNKRCI